MAPNSDIILIGARGAGKSTVGRALAENLSTVFIDLDDAALTLTGRPSVRDVFQQDGEPAWRATEIAAFNAVIHLRDARQPRVIALGGGAPMITTLRDHLRDQQAAGRMCVIYLRAEAATLESRLRSATGDRPSLTGRDAADEIADVLAARSSTYESLADVTVDASQSPSDVLSEIHNSLMRT